MIYHRVVNASPLIFLTRANLLEVLREPSAQVLVPEAVFDEIRELDDDDPAVEEVRRASWVSVVATPSIPAVLKPWRLHPGELAVMAVAIQTPDSQAIIEDLAARRCARSMDLPLQGTAGLIPVAKRKSMIAGGGPCSRCCEGRGCTCPTL